MSDVVWHEVMPFARRAKHVFISGFGEPLTHPQCLDLLEQLNDHRIPTTITTNAISLDPGIARRLAAIDYLEHINISIDSLDPATYRRIRGGSVNRALRGLSNLVRSMPDTSRITVSSVAMRVNIETLADFPPVLARLGIKSYIVQGLNDYTSYAAAQRHSDAADLALHLARLESACAASGVELVMTTPERTDAEARGITDVLERYSTDLDATRHQTRQCMLPWEMPYIDKDGRVFPCCIAGAASKSEVGRLGLSDGHSLEDVWLGDKYRKFRQELLDPCTTPDVCRTCTIVPTGAHPLRSYAAQLLSPLRETATDRVSVRVRNVGTEAWKAGAIRIGTTRPRDRASIAEHHSWLSGNRPCTCRESHVAPGEIATFCFRMEPKTTSVEHFQLVVESVAWLPNTKFVVNLSPTIGGRLRRVCIGAAGALTRGGRRIVRSPLHTLTSP
jgi:MoaA/NifB/PqqE/SkfB family radical SAM enzyme